MALGNYPLSLVIWDCDGSAIYSYEIYARMGLETDPCKPITSETLKVLKNIPQRVFKEGVDYVRRSCKVHPSLINWINTRRSKIYVVSDSPSPLPRYLLEGLIDPEDIYSTSELKQERGYLTGDIKHLSTKVDITKNIIGNLKNPIKEVLFYHDGPNDVALIGYLEETSNELGVKFTSQSVKPDQFNYSPTILEAINCLKLG